MFHRTLTRRLLAAAIAAPVSVALFAAPVSAGSSYFSRTTGRTAQAQWIQVDHRADGTPVPRGANTVTGNVHVGFLSIYEISRGNPDVFADISDFDCEPGFLPQTGGGHGEGPGEEDPNCTQLGFRFSKGLILEKPGDGVVLDSKLASASIHGRLELRGHDGIVGRPRIDTTWTGVGDTRRETQRYTVSEGGMTESYTSTATIRTATMGGIMGPMSWIQASCDAPNAFGCSNGSLANFKDVQRSRTK